MKLLQFRGPFRVNESKTLLNPTSSVTNVKYAVHIGIQAPYKWKLTKLDENDPMSILTQDLNPDITLDYSAPIAGGSERRQEGYYINQKGILEIDDIYESYLFLTINKNLPMETIIDVIVEDVRDN